MVIRSQHTVVPSGFVWSGPASEEPLSLTIAIPQRNIVGLHASLLDISDPLSKNYGRHLSKAQVEQLVAPKPGSVHAVINWLSKNGITSVASSASGDTLSIQIPVERANTLLNASFSTYVHENTNTAMTRTLSYSLPEHLHEHISFISPSTDFIPPISRSGSFQVLGQSDTPQALSNNLPGRHTETKRADIPPSCGGVMTPQCLQAIYNVPSISATAKNNTLFVAGFGDEFADVGDLSKFLATQRPDLPNGTYQFLSVDGEHEFSNGTIEASLDIQYTVGLATGVPITFVSASEGVTLNQMLEMANFLLAQETVPLVLSISFAGNEAPQSESYTEQAQTLCNAYAQLGARGTSVIFSTGDFGVGGGLKSSQCDAGQQFIPTFPPSCPFVTSVGSTQGISPEVGARFSAGGFSSIFPQPSYQKAAVAGYLAALGDTHEGLFDATGRAYPDVAMQGVNYSITVGGTEKLVFGTSASAPVFASVVALVNDKLLNAGRSPLGFLNPLLYSTRGGAAFNDITAGSNPGCGTDGFEATTGWDPVTGLGTVDFNKFLDVVLPGSVLVEEPAHTPQLDPVVQDSTSAGAVTVLVGLTQFIQSLPIFRA